MSYVRLVDVTKRFGDVTAVDHLNFEIEKGSCFSMLGPSGCGKTTTLRMVAGFEDLSEGEVWVGDRLLSSPKKNHYLPPEKRNFGMVFQAFAVWPHLSVYENVAFPLRIRKLPETEIRQRTTEALKATNLLSAAEGSPDFLSGGGKQRVALARALAINPDVMLLDEPLSSLDPHLREEMRFEIKALQQKLNVTVLYVTHDQEIGLAISDRVAIMDEHGGIQQIGTPWEIFEQAANPFVFNFMGIANFLPVRREQDLLFVGDGTQRIDAELPEGDADHWAAGFRPSDVMLSRTGDGLSGIVRRANFLGATMDYLIEIDGTHLRTSIETHRAISDDLMFRAGDLCRVKFLSLLWFSADQLKEEVGK